MSTVIGPRLLMTGRTYMWPALTSTAHSYLVQIVVTSPFFWSRAQRTTVLYRGEFVSFELSSTGRLLSEKEKAVQELNVNHWLYPRARVRHSPVVRCGGAEPCKLALLVVRPCRFSFPFFTWCEPCLVTADISLP
jgi:hypothetical protein